MIEINGISHINLTVNNYEKCVSFYETLLGFLGMAEVFKGVKMLYYVGGRVGITITRCDDQYKNEKFIQTRIGLHHLCFRAKSRADVGELHDFLVKNDTLIVHPPEEGVWAPGYYSLLFEDPDGIRLEIVHIPGQGVFEEGAKFDPGSDYE